jgi:ubiquinone/menaquinone biosynthesis C-methylase UbiE
METYDAVAKDYAEVFDDFSLRYFEQPWLMKQIAKYQPRSFLDAGCGHAYLINALFGTVPNLFAIEPSGEMFLLAKKRVGSDAEIFQASAEKLPFENESFDMIVSFLSFRYMQWDKALLEMKRTLKQNGVLIIIDLFAASFHPRYLHKYIETFFITRMQYMKHKDYHKKLSLLANNKNWQEMIKQHPKRDFSDAKKAIEKTFFIKEETLLSVGLRGKTIAFVCTK